MLFCACASPAKNVELSDIAMKNIINIPIDVLCLLLVFFMIVLFKLKTPLNFYSVKDYFLNDFITSGSMTRLVKYINPSSDKP